MAKTRVRAVSRCDGTPTKQIMDYYVSVMKETAEEIERTPKLFPSGSRLAYLILDTIDLRNNKSSPKTLPLCAAKLLL
jgi:hypothetical protein